jgi:hypothetical protein
MEASPLSPARPLIGGRRPGQRVAVAEGVHLMIGRRPREARQLDPRSANTGVHPRRRGCQAHGCWCCTTTCNANTPMGRRRDTKVGTFTPALYDEA